jgi:hypothetical protein
MKVSIDGCSVAIVVTAQVTIREMRSFYLDVASILLRGRDCEFLNKVDFLLETLKPDQLKGVSYYGVDKYLNPVIFNGNIVEAVESFDKIFGHKNEAVHHLIKLKKSKLDIIRARYNPS